MEGVDGEIVAWWVAGELGWWILYEYLVDLLNEDLVRNEAKGVEDINFLKQMIYEMVIDGAGEQTETGITWLGNEPPLDIIVRLCDCVSRGKRRDKQAWQRWFLNSSIKTK